MVLIDSDIFVGNFFERDKKYSTNKKLLDGLRDFVACTTIYNFFEVLGRISHNLSEDDFRNYFINFDTIFSVTVIYPHDKDNTLIEYFEYLKERLLDKMLKKMRFGDALILSTAEEYDISVLVTWNKEHFVSRTNMEVLTPMDFLESRSSSS